MEGIDLTDLARRTNNFSGSDLKNLAVCAALASLKDVIPDMWNSKKTLKKDKAKDADEAKDGENEEAGEKDPEAVADEAEEEEEDSDDDDEDTPDVDPRILRPIHFKAAFEQVSATCSRDMASVQKLRNWAAQFSRDSGAGLGTTPSPAGSLANGHAHPGATPTATASAAGGAASSTTTTGTGSTYRGLTGGDGLWDHRYETNMLSRFSNLPRPGGGSAGAGGSGAGGTGSGGSGSGTTTGRGSGGSGSGSGSGI